MSDHELDSSERTASTDVDAEDAKVIFGEVWRDLETEFGPDQLRFPKEIILLGGAPGAGKGTNTEFIMQARGLTCPAIVVSSLLDSPEARAMKDKGLLVGDREVMAILLRKMLEEEFRDGAILDGFPRTKVQVECVKLLVKQIRALHRRHSGTALAEHFRRPTIHVMVLFVDEKTSVERQLHRGREIEAANREVEQTGIGEIQALRPTDTDVSAAQKRYRVFKEQTWDALQSLREVFFYHLINAQGSFEEVEQNILDELRYQSSLELESDTFEIIRNIPTANELVLHARQELVKRLDGYVRTNSELFTEIVELINTKLIPIIKRNTISGKAVISNEDEVLAEPDALAMLIDICADRGYDAIVDKQLKEVPERIDLDTGEIHHRCKTVYRIKIYFEGSEIRRGAN